MRRKTHCVIVLKNIKVRNNNDILQQRFLIKADLTKGHKGKLMPFMQVDEIKSF